MFDAYQREAISGARSYIIKANRQYFRLAGYAGTGKSSVLKAICKGHPTIGCAYTGAAAAVMRSKGIDSDTIHRTIYDYYKDGDGWVFEKKRHLNGVVFVIDEASMIPRNLLNDVLSFQLPVILVGDPAQLQPVGGNDLMEHWDFCLRTVYRSDNEIIRHATHVRETGQYPDDFPTMKFGDPDVQYLCGYNKTRIAINKAVREKKFGLSAPQFMNGEKIVILKNYDRYDVFNGMVMTYVGDSTFRYCGNDYKLPIKRMEWDYAYALTVHKSQGSEFEKVAIVDEQCDYWSAANWRYTAVTRAKSFVARVV